MEVEKALYEQEVQEYQCRINNDKPSGQFFKGRVPQGKRENICIVDKFNGGGDIVDPSIFVLQYFAGVDPYQLYHHDKKEEEGEQAKCRPLQRSPRQCACDKSAQLKINIDWQWKHGWCLVTRWRRD
jgi:hypothetical protein